MRINRKGSTAGVKCAPLSVCFFSSGRTPCSSIRGIRVPGDGQTDVCEGPALDETGPEGEQEMGSEEKADHGKAPDAVVDAFHNAAYQLYNDTSFLRSRSFLLGIRLLCE